MWPLLLCGPVRWPRPPRLPRLTSSGLFCDLCEFQFDRGLPAKDRHRHLQALIVLVDIFYHAVEILEGALVDLDLLTHLEVDERARAFLALLHAAENRLHFGVAHRHRAALRAEKAGDTVDRVDQVIAAIRHLHVHQHVTGHETTLGGHLLATADFDHLFGGYQHLVDLVLETVVGDGLSDLLGDLLLEIRENTDRVPPLCHRRPLPLFLPAPGRIFVFFQAVVPARPETKSGAQPESPRAMSRSVASTTFDRSRIQGPATN